MSSYCYRLYAGNGNWITLGTKTTQDLLDIFEKGVSCRYPLTDRLFIDIIPHDVDCNSKNIDMLGLMRADLVYEPLETEPEVQQSMSHYVHSLLNEQGIIDAFPPLKSDGKLPNVDSLPTHRHLSLVPSTINATKRRVRPPSLSEGVVKTLGSTSFSSSVSSSDSPTLESIQPLPALTTSSASFGFSFPRKGKSSNSTCTSGSSSSTSSQKNHVHLQKRAIQKRSSSSHYKKYSDMSITTSVHLETKEEPLYDDRMEEDHHSVNNLDWFSNAPNTTSSLWIPNYPLREEEEDGTPFYHHHPETTKHDDTHPISPADIMHHYHHLAAATKESPMINMAASSGFEVMERNEQKEYNSDPILSPAPWSAKKQMVCMDHWKERSPPVMHCLEYPFHHEERGEEIKSRTANLLSHQ
ncbi:hypothetical protein K501DRAFT_280325 [Backusella circina FSU 941]|nr:hypothetical protein K501DRAFT_280325 [Backusella circina FSU 941]